MAEEKQVCKVLWNNLWGVTTSGSTRLIFKLFLIYNLSLSHSTFLSFSHSLTLPLSLYLYLSLSLSVTHTHTHTHTQTHSHYLSLFLRLKLQQNLLTSSKMFYSINNKFFFQLPFSIRGYKWHHTTYLKVNAKTFDRSFISKCTFSKCDFCHQNILGFLSSVRINYHLKALSDSCLRSTNMVFSLDWKITSDSSMGSIQQINNSL